MTVTQASNDSRKSVSLYPLLLLCFISTVLTGGCQQYAHYIEPQEGSCNRLPGNHLVPLIDPAILVEQHCALPI